ncbi:MAG TPA: heme ABC exporter ATP-binding protein CcmA [Stellaceae bacterium]|nr:heme ABC exporter ATP-binding protein CcmA [Stellaceae bacterium]
MPPAQAIPLPGDFTGSALACRRGEKLIFRRLDFVLPAGGALVLIGPNGSGKSSLLRLMAGLTPCETGVLAWGGTDIREDPGAHRSRLHFIGHSDALKPVLSARENLAFWAKMRGSAAAIEPALTRFGLANAAGLPCRYLSAGQKRRLALARLIAAPAALWLLDEPLTSLDTEAAAQLLTAIGEHRAQGGRVVLSTHAPIELADAKRLSLADFRPAPVEVAAELLA